MADHACCGTCRFWHPAGEQPKRGVCQRHAPRPTRGKRLYATPTPDLKNLMTIWPLTDRLDWCGEHEGKR